MLINNDNGIFHKIDKFGIMNATFKLECGNVVYGLVCLVCDNYMLQDGGSTNFYVGLTHHRYPTSKYLVVFIRVWSHWHHIE